MICLEATLPTFGEVLELLLNSVVDIKKLLALKDGLLGGLSSIDIEKPFAALLLIPKHLLNILKAIIDPCLAVVGGLVDDVMPLFNGSVKFSDVLKFDIAFLSESSDGESVLTSVKNKAVDVISSFIATIPLYICECIARVKEILDSAVAILSGFTIVLPPLPDFPKNISELKELFSDLTGRFIESLSDILLSEIENLKLLGVSLLTFVENTLGNVKSIALDTMNKLISTVVSIPTIIIDKLLQIVDTVKDLLAIELPSLCLEI